MSIAALRPFVLHPPRFTLLLLVLVLLVLLLPTLVDAQGIAEPAQNAVAGARVFGEKGCVECHSVRGLGGRGGADLAVVEARHSFDEMESDWALLTGADVGHLRSPLR